MGQEGSGEKFGALLQERIIGLQRPKSVTLYGKPERIGGVERADDLVERLTKWRPEPCSMERVVWRGSFHPLRQPSWLCLFRPHAPVLPPSRSLRSLSQTRKNIILTIEFFGVMI